MVSDDFIRFSTFAPTPLSALGFLNMGCSIEERGSGGEVIIIKEKDITALQWELIVLSGFPHLEDLRQISFFIQNDLPITAIPFVRDKIRIKSGMKG